MGEDGASVVTRLSAAVLVLGLVAIAVFAKPDGTLLTLITAGATLGLLVFLFGDDA